MINTQQALTELDEIHWKNYNLQKADYGTEYMKQIGLVKNVTIVECGGGWSTKDYLEHVILYGGKVITIDLCHPAETVLEFKGKEIGLCGKGDYYSKRYLFEEIQNKPELSKIFTWVNDDAYKWWGKQPKDFMIDFYFDDGTHYSDYLIPLFTEVIPHVKSKGLIGTHDYVDKTMKKFIEWLFDHPQTDKHHMHKQTFLMTIT